MQRVVVPGSQLESWTVVGDDASPVEPAERYLAFLTDVGRSPNTVKAYAHDLKDWFVFLAGHRADWRDVRLEDVGEFVAWLRLPPAGRDGRWLCFRRPARIAPSRQSTGSCRRSTSTRRATESSWGDLLRTWQPAGPRGTAWRPFLHHISKSQPAPRRAIRIRATCRVPRVLRPGEVQSILDGCDRLLFAVLYDTGMRVAEALGLRHECAAGVSVSNRPHLDR